MLDNEQKLTVMYLCADTMRKEKRSEAKNNLSSWMPSNFIV